MSRKKAQKPWLKLYRHEGPDFRKLPLYVRGLAAELLKFADEKGHLCAAGDGEDMITNLARGIGAHTGDRRMLKRDIPTLIEHGYLAVKGGYLVISKLLEFQGRSEEEPNETSTNGERTEHESITNDARTGTRRARTETKSEVSARNHSGDSLAGTCAHSERERERREEGDAPPAPVQSLPTPTPTEPVQAKAPEPPPAPPSSPAVSVTAEPFLAVLRSHPDLAGVARPTVAERVARNSAAKFKLEDFAKGCADIARKVQAARDIGAAWSDERINASLERFAETAFRDRIEGRGKPTQANDITDLSGPPSPQFKPDPRGAPPPPSPEILAALAAARETIGTGGRKAMRQA